VTIVWLNNIQTSESYRGKERWIKIDIFMFYLVKLKVDHVLAGINKR